jgi:hypothetical protein
VIGRRVQAAWLLALALACTRSREPGAPAPLAVTPSRATADQPVRVEIAGRDFDPEVKADFNAGGSGLEARFSAWLEPTGAGSAVPLADVALTARRTLLATVPAGLAAGLYRLVVTDPGGRTGALEQAYRVVSSAASVARFDVVLGDAPKAGIKFPVTVIALDARGAVVEGFEGTVTLADTAGALAPHAHGPFLRGRGHGKISIKRLVASDALTVSDGAGHSGTSPTFSVTGGPPMALAFASAPLTVAAGRCSPAIELTLVDGGGAAAVAGAALAVAIHAAPPGVGIYTNPACTEALDALTIPAGEGAASFHFRAASAGAVTLRALPATLPNAIQVETVTP